MSWAKHSLAQCFTAKHRCPCTWQPFTPDWVWKCKKVSIKTATIFTLRQLIQQVYIKALIFGCFSVSVLDATHKCFGLEISLQNTQPFFPRLLQTSAVFVPCKSYTSRPAPLQNQTPLLFHFISVVVLCYVIFVALSHTSIWILLVIQNWVNMTSLSTHPVMIGRFTIGHRVS